MNYSTAYLISRLEKIAADNDRDNRRAANPEIVAARAANDAARAACQYLVDAADLAFASAVCAAQRPDATESDHDKAEAAFKAATLADAALDAVNAARAAL